MKKENRGGARSNAGRKPALQISDRERKELLKYIKRAAKQAGKESHWQVLAEMVFGIGNFADDMTPRDRLAALRMIGEWNIAKASEKSVDVTKHEGPAIFLPEQHPRKATIHAINGGKTD